MVAANHPFYAIIGICILLTNIPVHVYSFQQSIISTKTHRATTRPTTTNLFSTAIQPSSTSTIGTVGSGYISILLAKLAAHRNHGKSWIICPAADMEIMQQLSEPLTLPNLELVPASDTDRVEELLSTTDAILMATDDVDSVINEGIINYILDNEKCNQLKRVVTMSRNLNGSGMGMFVSASKAAANAQVWDNSNKAAYQQYEDNVKSAAKKCNADWTIVRAGTLKGGSVGDTTNDESLTYSQYLSEAYYEVSKTDIITWQLLFDCNVRGVKLNKGDSLPGPGAKAVFTATGSEEHDGDTGRCGLAEAMVRSLELDEAANIDFGVGTVAARETPSEEEWTKLFQDCL